jgi:hypothetical protein
MGAGRAVTGRLGASPLIALAALAALAGCGPKGAPERENNVQASAEPETIDIPQTVTHETPGTTPMAQRVAVIGLLNKRNGLSRDLTLKPGQAVRVGDVIVRLRACETTAPWEIQQLTGAFVQLDVRDPKGVYHRVFSGWLYKETPSLNAVQHPIYDVWPKSCAMTHPEAGPSTVRAGSAASNRSRAPNSAAAAAGGANSAAPAPAPAGPAAPSGAADSASDNRAR